MILSVEINEINYQVDPNDFHDISIPLNFNGKQPNSYGVPFAKSKAFQQESFIGDTRKGGGCNFEEIQFIPHCNGTHTECIGHITNDRYYINNQLKDVLIPSTLISIEAQGDQTITAEQLKTKLDNTGFLKGLIIRTTPNPTEKKNAIYTDIVPPYLDKGAIEYLNKLGVEHLLIDLPSLDRIYDEGKLSAHHIFWGIKEGSHEVNVDSHMFKTITEFIYVDNTIDDGIYILNLQIAPFVSDAAPSRPIIFNITKKAHF